MFLLTAIVGRNRRMMCARAISVPDTGASMNKPGKACGDTGLSTHDDVSRRQFVSGVAAALGYLSAAGDVNASAVVGADDGTGLAASGPKKEWHQLPDVFAMVYLIFLRDWLRNAN